MKCVASKGAVITMKRLSNNDIMDYLDGAFSPQRQSEIEAHLQSNEEDAELVNDLKMAQMALVEWDKSEPVRASDDFWIKVREQLPAQPQRSPIRGWLSQLGAALWPSYSPVKMTLRVAAVAALLALLSMFLTPDQSKHVGVADTPATQQLTKQDRDNILNREPVKRPATTVRPGAVPSTNGDNEN